MTFRAGAARLALLAVAVAAGAGCKKRPAPVALLLEKHGVVEREEAPGRWTTAPAGFEFVVGDVMRTAANSRARLRLANATVIRVDPGSRLRFLHGSLPAGDKGQAATDLEFELGSAEIEHATEEIAVVTPLGPTRVKPGARLRVHADGTTAALEVIVGQAVVLAGDRETVVDSGQGVRVKIGGAEVERFQVTLGDAVVEPIERPAPPPAKPAAPAEPAPPAPAAAATAPSTPAAAAAETPEAAAAAHARADVTLRAGDSGTLHDTRRPLAVRLRLDGLCPDQAVVEVGSDRHPKTLDAAGAVVLQLRPGAQRYRVRCSGDTRSEKPRAAGLLTVKLDSGNIPLSRRAPVNVLDADGRRYTVLFQSRLPALTLAWGGAPPAAHHLELHVESSAGERQFETTAARHVLPSGALPEGTYTWWYATDEGRLSPRTTVTIRFDNAAPTAQFFRAAEAAEPAAPGAIPIDGVTMEGAKVTAAGQPVPVDDHGRFRVAVAPLSGDDAVAVRLEHPRTGVHYYVRRAPTTKVASVRARRPR